jgi:hypothetical protein
MEAASTSETSVNFYQTIRHNIPENSYLHENLKSYLIRRLGYKMKDQALIPGRAGFSLPHNVQIGSGAHTASYPTGTRTLSSGVKRPGCETNHSPHLVLRLRIRGAIPPLSHIRVWRGAQLSIRDKFM